MGGEERGIQNKEEDFNHQHGLHMGQLKVLHGNVKRAA
jgi:hypothetical protein